jgi:hypothetical protein
MFIHHASKTDDRPKVHITSGEAVKNVSLQGQEEAAHTLD